MKTLTTAILSLGLGMASSIACAADNKPVILINAFEVPAGKIDETIKMWEKARDFLKQQPGYISTSLHRANKPNGRFPLINVANWSSAEAFFAATKKMRAQAGLPKIEGVVTNPDLYRVIRN